MNVTIASLMTKIVIVGSMVHVIQTGLIRKRPILIRQLCMPLIVLICVKVIQNAFGVLLWMSHFLNVECLLIVEILTQRVLDFRKMKLGNFQSIAKLTKRIVLGLYIKYFCWSRLRMAKEVSFEIKLH